MLELVVVTQFKTLHLFLIFLDSFEFHYKSETRLHIIADQEFVAQFPSKRLKQNYRLVEKSKLLPNFSQYDGYISQQYFKLRAQEFVKTPYYLVMDDDFLFCRKTEEKDFFINGKPIWFFQDWQRAGPAIVWKDPSADFLKQEVPYCFMAGSHYLLKTEVVRQFLALYPAETILQQKTFSEYSVYGAYAWHSHRSDYLWVNNYWGDEAISYRINQVPPDYLVLDPVLNPKDYSRFHHLAFWSHWSRCQEKMKEFFEASK